MRLSHDQVVDLTQKKRPSAQARVLDAMQIRYRRRPNGTIVVLLSDLHAPTQTRSASPQVRL